MFKVCMFKLSHLSKFLRGRRRKKLLSKCGLAGYELIITNSAYGLVGYIYQLISGASSKNNC